jgi:hypothetical protein
MLPAASQHRLLLPRITIQPSEAGHGAKNASRTRHPSSAEVTSLVPRFTLLLLLISSLVFLPVVPPHNYTGPNPYEHPLCGSCQQRLWSLFREEPPQQLNQDSPDQKAVPAADTEQQESVSPLCPNLFPALHVERSDTSALTPKLTHDGVTM